ncbi:PucR family transcriptional regulator [Gordonia alkanivorans]|uniref:PucR family transcriptional regulator n=1 Tax=Gordonia alkanivorans TaxID=84096 RepID=UPI002446B703|nr:PucR family transcriptional regulator [Gordonia alkanivorans]MDH3007196.1 PucR family transcriptional regulator ligand-binding domain-containing protein [Gordonia alkanivorans]MDH3017001.1 PucR family transcriptional regulator ligand-binding domain-containing protein [Gordonia alkanivorans]MDH3042252.1 PucR family transcriptional regulator ligand-binding domain-containing protein [Gordonia alkanivorans]MDH3057774.1 PucR family transcriptional regulator ligand-binding domain-containing protei
MALTVQRLSHNADLGLTLVAGHSGADRVIEWAHAIELADPAPWITGGELVMTTGLAIGPSDSEQFDYVTRLVRARAAALAVDTGMTFDAVPDGIRAAGDALGLPVLAVPPHTPFIAVTRAVIDDLTADRVRAVQQVVDQQDKFARDLLRGGIPHLVTALGRALSCSVVLVDAEGGALSVHGPDAARALEHARSVSRGSGRRRQAGSAFADEHATYLVQSVSVAREPHGYLAVASPAALQPEERLLVAHAVALLSIELGKPAKVLDAEQRLRTVVTQALVNLGPELDAGLLRYFGFDEDTRVVAITVTNVGPALPALRETTDVITRQSVPYLLSPIREGLLLVVSDDRGRDWVVEFVARLGARLERTLRAGRGGTAVIAETAVSLRQARAALHLGPTQETVVDFSDTGTFSMLFSGRSPGELSAMSRIVLGPLEDYDAAHGSSVDLVTALRTWLRNDAHIESAARELGVHRHTMRSRMAKVGQLLGRDLDSAEVRVELWIAVKARELLDVFETD